MRIAATLFFALSFSLGIPPTASAQANAEKNGTQRTVIEVGSPEFRPYMIAIPDARPLKGKGKAKTTAIQDVTDALRWDFDTIATFKVVDPKSYLENPKKAGLAAASIDFSDWLNVGAEGLIKVGVKVPKPGSVVLDMRLYEVAAGRQLLRKEYRCPEAQARDYAHRFADEVVYTLTGTKGIFRTKIAAVRQSKKGREIWVIDADGRNARAVTRNGSINLLPSWTRDGQALIFTSYIRHNPNLYSMPLRGGRFTLISGEEGLNVGGALNPAGDRIALTLTRDGNSEIYVGNPDGTRLKRLTNEWAIDSSPSWSPDGERIAFVSARHGDPHVFVMDKAGDNARRLTDRGTYNQTPDWSPRGDLIAFTARDERNRFDIFTVHVETKEIRRLTQDQGNNEEPSFSPDGNQIVFTSTREGKSQLWVMSLDGSNQKRLTKAGGFTTPAWSPYLP